MLPTAAHFEERFSLDLSEAWRRWFDSESHSLELVGHFRHPVTLAELTPDGTQLWQGLMPPDCIPVIGNGYGDWICARITEENHIGELLHWYHGGGDWIPVGHGLHQGLWHDLIDGFRPVRQQALRGDLESSGEWAGQRQQQVIRKRLTDAGFIDWLLSDSHSTKTERCLRNVIEIVLDDERMSATQYPMMLELLVEAIPDCSAAIADLAEWKLQICDPFQFDWDGEPTLQSLLKELREKRAQRGLEGLGWNYNLLAGSYYSAGHLNAMQALLIEASQLSTYSEQSVRFRFVESGKMGLKQSLSIIESLGFQQLLPEPFGNCGQGARSQRQTVFDFFRSEGQRLVESGSLRCAHKATIEALTNSGFMSWQAALQPLDALVSICDSLGWNARSRVAQCHLDGIRHRLGIL